MIAPAEVFKEIYPSGAARPLSVVWTVKGDLPYLNGHFPQSPILPAVAIIDASTYLLGRALDQEDLTLKCILMAKFLSPVVPGQQVRIDLASGPDREWQIEWKEEVTARVLATLRVQI